MTFIQQDAAAAKNKQQQLSKTDRIVLPILMALGLCLVGTLLFEKFSQDGFITKLAKNSNATHNNFNATDNNSNATDVMAAPKVEYCEGDPCGWKLYDGITKRIRCYTDTKCQCEPGTKCMETYDDESVNAYSFYCRPLSDLEYEPAPQPTVVKPVCPPK